MGDESERSWMFFTHHAHVLICLARDPTLRLRDIAASVGVTERATATLVSELVHAGYLQRFKDGRRNRYHVDLSGPLRHDITSGVSVGAVFAPLIPVPSDSVLDLNHNDSAGLVADLATEPTRQAR